MYFSSQMEDSGLYECQVSTTPVMSHYIYLTVAEPYTEIVGGAEIYLDEGSMMNITCLVKDSPEPPNYIFWYHNKKVQYIQYLHYGWKQYIFIGRSATAK
jgi:hypothetical protein